jgi:hypothetical protein
MGMTGFLHVPLISRKGRKGKRFSRVEKKRMAKDLSLPAPAFVMGRTGGATAEPLSPGGGTGKGVRDLTLLITGTTTGNWNPGEKRR